MIKTEYQRDMGRNYLIFREETEPEEGYFLKLLLNTKIEGLLPLEVRSIDGFRECYYDVTGKQSLKGVFERGGMDKKQLEEIFEGMKTIIQRGEEYLLQPEDYVLEPETIFLNLNDFSLYLCYFPGYKKPMEEKWQEFTEYLMNAVDYRNEETVLYVYSLYKGARQKEGFLELPLSKKEKKGAWEWEGSDRRDGKGELEEGRTERKPEGRRRIQTEVPAFEERIEEEVQTEVYPKKVYALAVLVILAGVLAAAAVLMVWQPGPVQAGAGLMVIGALVIYGLIQLFSPERKEPWIEHQVEFIPAEEKQSEVFSWQRQEEDESTVVLAAGGLEGTTKENCFLRAEDSRKYQDIELIEFPFFFGKLRTQVNSSIESPAVSRFHAKIEYLGGEYYLVDLNSTNGTYLNGERLKSHERRKLMPMDKVRFADVGYYFEAAGSGF